MLNLTRHCYSPVRYTKFSVEYVGATLSLGEESVQVMSDIWEMIRFAKVWDEAEGRVAKVWLDGRDRGEVDATAEVLAKVEAWEAVQAAKRAAEAARRAAEEAERERRTVRRGKTIRVVRGRKVPLGTTGVCIWIGEGRWGWRVGIKVAEDEVYWTAASNVEVVLDEAKAA